MSSSSKKLLTVFPLAMLITGSIDSIRNLPGTALFGSTLIFFSIFAAVFFLLPTGLVSATLTAQNPNRGGIYQWCRAAMGARMAALAIWLQWINTMVWFPTILSFIAGTATYLLAPELAQNRFYLVSVILVVFWLLTLLNLKGITTAARFASFCTIVGMVIPMVFIIVLEIIWLAHHNPIQIHFDRCTLWPSFNNMGTWASLTAIMASFLGIELATVHITHTKNPSRSFPRALLVSIIIILVTMILGSLAIAMVIPHKDINLVAGVMQTFSYYLKAYHMTFMGPVLTVLILIGSVGGMINWLVSPAKGLLQAANDHFLPAYFRHHNEAGVPSRLLIIQAIFVSVIASAFVLMPSINGSYWLLTDLSTQLYMIMYMLLFISGIILYRKHVVQLEDTARNPIPGGKIGFNTCCIFGLIGTVTSIIVGFFPPQDVNVGTQSQFMLLMGSGIIILSVPVCLLWYHAHRKHNPR
jgi:glutamate:GABA antiporter